MPEFSAWLAGVKERLEKATFPGVDHLIRRGDEDATDLALAVRIIEAVQQTIVNWRADDAGIQATFADDLEYALHLAFEEKA